MVAYSCTREELSDLAHALTKYMLFLIVWWPVDVLLLQSGVWIMLKPSSEFIVAKTCPLTIMFFFLGYGAGLDGCYQLCMWKGVLAPAVPLLATCVIYC
jgi:hypothetical protein